MWWAIILVVGMLVGVRAGDVGETGCTVAVTPDVLCDNDPLTDILFKYSTLIVHPGVYDWLPDTGVAQNPPMMITTLANITGWGEPGSIIINSSITPFWLNYAGVSISNVTVIGGLKLQQSGTVSNVIVDCTDYPNRHGLHADNAVLALDSVKLISSSATDKYALYSNISTINANGPVEIIAEGTGLYQSAGTITFKSSVSITSQGTYAVQVNEIGSIVFMERPSIPTANTQFYIGNSTLKLYHVLNNLTFECDPVKGGDIISVPGSYVIPSTAASCRVERRPVVLISPDLDFIEVPSNTDQMALVYLELDNNTVQPATQISAEKRGPSIDQVYEDVCIITSRTNCPMFLERGYRLTILGGSNWHLEGYGRRTIEAVDGAPVPPPSVPFVSSNTTDQVPISLKHNTSSPVLAIIPSGSQVREDEKADVAFGNIQEINTKSEVECTADIQITGEWKEVPSVGDVVYQTFRFQSPLFVNPTVNNTAIVLESTLFRSTSNIVYASSAASGNYSFGIDPSLAKLSMTLLNWPWSDEQNKLQMAIKVKPPFISYRQLDGVPQARMTTFELQHDEAAGGPLQTNVRMVDFALSILNPEGSEEGDRDVKEIAVRFWANEQDSTINIEFPYSGAYLFYDPDLSLVVSTSKASGGSDTGMIVAVSVVVPVAVIIVLLAIIGGSAVVYYKRRNISKAGMIGFESALDSTGADESL